MVKDIGVTSRKQRRKNLDRAHCHEDTPVSVLLEWDHWGLGPRRMFADLAKRGK